MEVACQLGLRNATLRANWLSRLQNEEADALTKSDFRHFTLARSVPVKLDELNFFVLNDLFKTGDAYVEGLAASKAQAKRARAAPAPSGAKRLRKPVPFWEKPLVGACMISEGARARSVFANALRPYFGREVAI